MQDFTGRDHVILEQALLLPAAERPAYLDRACGENADLRRRVEALLQARETPPVAADDDDWPTAIPRPAVVGQKVGPYKLVEELGQGGYGTVFLAEQETPVRRRVALKIIKLGMDTEEVIARFEAERQALAMMDHPNIARVFDAGATESGRPFFVMELVRGKPITQFCDEKKLSIAGRLELFILVCNAVQHAHQKGIIHRDIKPSNILVIDHDGTPTPKIIDFGIAKATGGRLTDKTYYTTNEEFVGTPAYMSPEQAEMTNLDVDTRSDIYSLGVVLYQLLTSRTPLDVHELQDAGVDEIRRRVREEEPVRPSVCLAKENPPELAEAAGTRGTDPAGLIAQVKGDLDWIVMCCLEKDRQRRYDSTSALAQDLQRHLDNQPVVARPPSTLYSLQKMVRRHRVAFATTSVVAAALVIGLWAVTWSYYNEKAARQTAEAEKTRADEQTAIAKTAGAEAERQKQEVQAALARADYLAALSLLQDDRMTEAMAHLVRALRSNPDNRPAAALLCSILAMENWLLPVNETPQPASARGNQGGGRGGRAGGGGVGRGQNPAGEAPGRRGGQFNPVQGRSSDGSRELRQPSFGGPVQVVDIKSGREFPVINTDSAILSANISSDGHLVMTISADRSVRIWDADTGEPLTTPMRNNGLARLGQFSGEDQRVVTQSVDPNQDARGGRRAETLTMWQIVEGPGLLLQVQETSPISQFAQSSDGRRLLTLSDNATKLSLIDAATGNMAGEPVKLSQEARTALFSPDNAHVLVMMRPDAQPNSCLLEIRDAKNLAVQSQVTIEERNGPPGGRGLVPMAFNADGRQLLVGFGRSVYLIDVATGEKKQLPVTLAGTVSAVAVSPDGRRILLASTTAQIWDLDTQAQVLEFAKDSGALSSASFSPDGKLVVTVSRSSLVQVWDAQTGEVQGETIRHGDQNVSAVFSPDSARLLTYTRPPEGPANNALVRAARLVDSTARVWDAATGQPVSAIMPCGDNLKSAEFSADGRWVLTSGDAARVWDAATGLAVSVPLPCRAALFSPDDHRLLVLSDDGKVNVWPFTDHIGPPWILDVAEMLARSRIDSTGSAIFYSGKTLDELRRDAAQSPDAGDPMVRWARKLLGASKP